MKRILAGLAVAAAALLPVINFLSFQPGQALTDPGCASSTQIGQQPGKDLGQLPACADVPAPVGPRFGVTGLADLAHARQAVSTTDDVLIAHRYGQGPGPSFATISTVAMPDERPFAFVKSGEPRDSYLGPHSATIVLTADIRSAAWHPIPRWHAYLWAIEHADGCVYTWGGAGPCWRGFDCSGVVVAAYASVGIWLPHNTDQMLWSGRLTRISASQLKPGDLVFMYPDSAGGAGHVALYTGWWDWVFGAHTFGELSGFSNWSNLYGFYHVNGAA